MKRMFQAGITLLLTAGILIAGLAGCAVPVPGYADYDVSGYIQALLDSSYHDTHEALMELSKITEESAKANNTTTVENAVINFCNTYNLSPSEEQLNELEKIMRQAFVLTKYMVKDERKTDTGYYLEVEIASITNFEGREADIERLKNAAQQEAAAANAPKTTVQPDTSDDDEYDEYGDEYDDDEDADADEEPTQEVPEVERVNANDLFIEKVLDFCKQELANISYDPEMRTVALDIRQTDEGELQLDMNQLDVIDRTVIRFVQ
ncbi:MAG: hypothetical protein J1E06_10440 [Acutalibacter sp.]|nr:hypothetical protein [Acutalibacter sp.]